MEFNSKSLALIIILVLFAGALWITAQTTDNETPTPDCSWQFVHDPVTSAGAAGGGGGGGGGGSDLLTGPWPSQPAQPVFPRTIWARSQSGYHFNGCTGELYRVNYDSTTGAVAQLVVLN